MIVAGAFFVHRAFARKAVTIPLALFGIGAIGVGVFPGNHLAPHQLFAMTAFISGGIAAVLAARVLVAPLRQMSVAIGVISLVSFVLAMFMLEWAPVAEIGEGGSSDGSCIRRSCGSPCSEARSWARSVAAGRLNLVPHLRRPIIPTWGVSAERAGGRPRLMA